MFSNGSAEALDDRAPEVLIPQEESRLKVTLAKHRFGLDEAGNRLPKLRCITYAEALFEALMHRFGARISLLVGILAGGMAALVGAPAGYRGGFSFSRSSHAERLRSRLMRRESSTKPHTSRIKEPRSTSQARGPGVR